MLNTIKIQEQDGSEYREVSLDSEPVISFGPFRLLPLRRLLLEGDTQVRLGSRALDILIALIERPGELIDKSELMNRVWPNTLVEAANLTVHISALRRALGDGRAGYRYLINIPGRGYRFVAPVTHAQEKTGSAEQLPPAKHNLPASMTRLIGRTEAVAMLVQQLFISRSVTIVGPGGIGKSAVALTVAEEMLPHFEHGVWAVDLAPVGEPRLVANALASALGFEIRNENPLPALAAMLREKKMLLLLGNCEHVVEAAAAWADSVLRSAPGVRVLATSRESLRIKGEHVYRLPSLETPPVTTPLSASEALEFPSVQLFVERAAAAMSEYELTDADAPIVAEICRKLDGLPLAIEFAAARLDTYGIQGVASRLDDRMRLLTAGRRGALPRHHTMRAVIDWSYGLLTEAEQKVLQRVSIFVGGFSLEAAGAVCADAMHPETEIFENITALVSKSLVSADFNGVEPRFRLLETTRAYALAKLAETGEQEMLGRRHAEYFRDLLNAAPGHGYTRAQYSSFGPEVDNIRAALTWAFAPLGDEWIGVQLAGASAPMWLERAHLAECHRWVAKALDCIDAVAIEAHEEMVLRAAFGISLIFTKGMVEEARRALNRAAELAEGLGDTHRQLSINHVLWYYEARAGNFNRSLAIARWSATVAAQLSDAAAMATANRMLGISLFQLGDLRGARAHLERAVGRQSRARRKSFTGFDLDDQAFALGILANVLWLQGFPDRALDSGDMSISEAQATEHPVPLCLALKCEGSVSLKAGDLSGAERAIASLVDHAKTNCLDADYGGGMGLQGQLAGGKGDAVDSAPKLRTALDAISEARYSILLSEFLMEMSVAMARSGDTSEGLSAIEEAVRRTDWIGERWLISEILRVKAELLLQKDRSNSAEAERLYLESLMAARNHGALSWELRIAMSLGQLYHADGRIREACDLLGSVYSRFTEGFETADLRRAIRLLDEWVADDALKLSA